MSIAWPPTGPSGNLPGTPQTPPPAGMLQPAPLRTLSGDALATMPPGRAFSEIVAFAVETGASDLFFLTEEGAVRVALRRMGRLETMFALSLETGRNILNVMKADAGIDLGDRRRPHEGRFIQQLGERPVDLRINIIPTLHGEDVAVRIHDSKSGLRTLDQIGFLRSELARMQSILDNRSGLVLVTGATATGKTTTLYACLQHLNNGTRKINTLEDPVEYVLPGLRQSQVHSKIGLDFPELLRNILRQSPDVIMVGEIRDEETAATAVRAANSGTLVLSTLHAPIAAGAVQSMLALNVNRYFLSNCLLAVVAQRLVRTLCPDCRVPFDLTESPGTFADIRPLLEQGQGDYIFGHGACAKCQYQGFNGRTAILEFMTFNRRMRELVAQGSSAEEIQQAAIDNGMIEFRRASMVKVAQGVTTTEEILREMPAEQLGIEM
ncbi:MAG TPA: GspE/PulE family protein [Caulifigura sp.]|nr:GspE/PulE family protein [Caulifigura sp.]